jgi:MFS family permease
VLAASIFLLGQATSPLVWSWCIRRHGRKACLSYGVAAFVAFQAPIIAANGVATILVLRFFSGLSGGAPLLTIFSLLTDLLWSPVDSDIAISILSGALVVGPVAGHMIGAYVTESHYLGWRWPSVIISAASAFIGFACWLAYFERGRFFRLRRMLCSQKVVWKRMLS